MSIASTTVDSTPALSDGPGKKSTRLLFWAGAILAVAVVLAFFAQVFWLKALITPWYLPVGGTIAAVLVLGAAVSRPRWWRIGGALFFVALAGLEWCFLLLLTVLPKYTGPINEGSPIPAFHATLADGKEIDESYFKEPGTTVLVFFQGSWCPFCMTQLGELESAHGDFERVGARVVAVTLEDLKTAAETQRQFPHLAIVSDERQQLSGEIDVINPGFAPDGGDCAAPTILLVDNEGTVRWLHRPVRFIARPSAADLVARVAAAGAKP